MLFSLVMPCCYVRISIYVTYNVAGYHTSTLLPRMHGTSVIYTATSRRTDHRAGEGEEVNDEQYDANPSTAVSLSDTSKQGSGLLSVFCSTTLLTQSQPSFIHRDVPWRVRVRE